MGKTGECIYLCQKPLCLLFWQAGRPPTSIQLLIMSMSSSSLVAGLAPSSSSDSSEGESYKKSSTN